LPENERDTIELFGEKGSIRFSTYNFDPIVLTTSSGPQEFINERPEHVQYNLIEEIVQFLNGEGKVPSTGITGARTSKVMDEIVKDFYRKSK
jgi:hypothetical protein